MPTKNKPDNPDDAQEVESIRREREGRERELRDREAIKAAVAKQKEESAQPAEEDAPEQQAVEVAAIEDPGSYYQPTGELVPISGYVLDRVAYYYASNAAYSLDSGRLNDPDAVNWLQRVGSIRPVRSEFTTAHNQVFEVAPISHYD